MIAAISSTIVTSRTYLRSLQTKRTYICELTKMPNVKLRSSDGEIFVVDAEILQCSGLLKDFCIDGEDEVIPVPNVEATILSKVILWATYHKDDPAPIEVDEHGKPIDTHISGWDENFLKVDQSTIFGMILAANYLDIKGLQSLTCQHVANLVKGKSADEIKKMFAIP